MLGRVGVVILQPPEKQAADHVRQHLGLNINGEGQSMRVRGVPGQPNKIFEPLFTTKEKGTGSGLAICYEIVKDYEGEITVESMLGEGAIILQLVYKTAWLGFIFIPHLLQGSLSVHVWILAIVFLSYVILDLIAIPFPRLLRTEASGTSIYSKKTQKSQD